MKRWGRILLPASSGKDSPHVKLNRRNPKRSQKRGDHRGGKQESNRDRASVKRMRHDPVDPTSQEEGEANCVQGIRNTGHDRANAPNGAQSQ